MFSLVGWLKSAKWYYLLAIAVVGLIILTIIIKIIVVLVKKARRSRRSNSQTSSKRGQVTDLRVITVTPAQPITVSTKKAIIPPQPQPPFAIPIPSAPPLEIEYFNHNNDNDPQVYDSQGQVVKAPFAPIHPFSATSLSIISNKKTVPQKKTSIPLEKQRPSSSVVEKKAEVLARYQPALSNYSRKQMKKELELAEAQELQLGTEISLEEYNSVSVVEEYNSVEEQDNSSQIWIEERNGASNLPVQEKKILVPEVFGPYNFIHMKAAEKIQRCYRNFIQNLEKEISALFREQSRLITINKNTRKL